MFLGYHEENDICLDCMNGRLKYCKPMQCVCCTISPCLKCIKKKLTCDKCGLEIITPDYNDVFVDNIKK